MNEKPLTQKQLDDILEIKKAWLEESKALASSPEPERHPNQLDGNMDDPYKLLTKKYMKKIMEIRGRIPKSKEVD